MRGTGFEPANPLRDRMSYPDAPYENGVSLLKSCAFDQALLPPRGEALETVMDIAYIKTTFCRSLSHGGHGEGCNSFRAGIL